MGWPVQVVGTTGSTNADLVARARSGERGPAVLAARSQTAGRGRLGRRWQSPPGASLSVSVLWAPPVPPAAWTWVPLVVGLGVVDGLAGLGVRAALKWPNDVVAPAPVPAADATDRPTDRAGDGALAGLAKLAGILVDVVGGPAGPVVVAGVGVNLLPPDLPPDDRTAARVTSVAQLRAGGRASTDQDPVPADLFDEALGAVVAGLQRRLLTWGEDPDGAGVREDYRAVCSTLGRRVRVGTPAGTRDGVAVDVDAAGALVLDTGAGPVAVSAGDVEHVR